jgi:ABC-type antimicrobial peptide transport system permease subunit
MSYAVAQRTREIGVRLALGARPAAIAGMVVRQGLLPALAGAGAGIAAALALTRLLASRLVGVGAADPVTFAAVTLALLAVTATACALPARRAARIDPMVALRAD